MFAPRFSPNIVVTKGLQQPPPSSALNESIDTTSPSGKLIFHVFAAPSEFERSLIQKRTKAGLAAARARGRKGGRPKKLNRDQVRKAKAMLSDPMMTKSEVVAP